MFGFNIFVLFLLVLFIAMMAGGVKVVPQGWNYTVERFGRFRPRTTAMTVMPTTELSLDRPLACVKQREIVEDDWIVGVFLRALRYFALALT
jgi:hypothetical protein